MTARDRSFLTYLPLARQPHAAPSQPAKMAPFQTAINTP